METSVKRGFHMAAILFFSLLTLALGAPSYPRALDPNATNATEIPSNASTTLRITDRTGADVTSSFQVMMYSGASPVHTNSTGLEDRQLSKVTYINDCLPMDAFKESKCDVWRNRIGSLQAWTKTCYKFVTHYDADGVPASSSLRTYNRNGHCARDEICVNSFGPTIAEKQGPQIAMCIAKSEFGPTFDKPKTGLKRILDAVLESIRSGPSPSKQPKVDSSESGDDSGKGSSTVMKSSSAAAITMSKADGQTPIEAKTLELAAWNDADGQNADAGPQHSKKCRMCSDLELRKVDADSDHLDLEVSLLKAGTIAGILWIAVMSG